MTPVVKALWVAAIFASSFALSVQLRRAGKSKHVTDAVYWTMVAAIIAVVLS